MGFHGVKSMSWSLRPCNCLLPFCVSLHVGPGNGGVRNKSQSFDGLDLYHSSLSLSMRGLLKSISTRGDQCDGLFSLRDAPNLWVASAGSHTIGFQQRSYVRVHFLRQILSYSKWELMWVAFGHKKLEKCHSFEIELKFGYRQVSEVYVM